MLLEQFLISMSIEPEPGTVMVPVMVMHLSRNAPHVMLFMLSVFSPHWLGEYPGMLVHS